MLLLEALGKRNNPEKDCQDATRYGRNGIMAATEEELKAQENYKRMSQFRGLFLDTMINLEGVCSLLIAVHFCGNNNEKLQEFMHAVAYKENFSLSFKFGLISFIFKNHHKHVLDKDKKLIEDLDKFNKIRNHFAHREFDFDLDEGIGFTHYKTDKNKIKAQLISFSEEEYQANLDRLLEITKTIKQVYLEQKKQ